MESARFDALTRGLAGLLTRRTAAGLLGLSTLGVPSLLEAKKRKKKKKCKKKKCGECRRCKKGKCKPKPNGTACSLGTCQNGTCQGPTCPPAQVCELSELCCGTELSCGDGACFCPDNFALCSCPANAQFCNGTEFDSCCLATDDCHPSGACVTDTCSADNDACEVEAAFCGESCLCFTTAVDTQVCSDISGIFDEGLCPETSECASNGECQMGEVCVDLSCCGDGGFIGRCLPAGCPVGREGKASDRQHQPLRLLR